MYLWFISQFLHQFKPFSKMIVSAPYLRNGTLTIHQWPGRANTTSVDCYWGATPVGSLCLECRTKKSFTVAHPLCPYYADLTDAFNSVLGGDGPCDVRIIFRDRFQATLKIVEFTIVLDPTPSPFV
jgi:hypothetical protein